MRRAVLGLAVLPLAAFPLFAGALMLVDATMGEGVLQYQLGYEQRTLAEQFLGDFLRALPASYVFSLLLAGLGLLVVRLRGLDSLRPVVVGASAALGLTFGSLLSGSALHAESLALAVAGALFGVAKSALMDALVTARAERGR